jgi:hypothetical protein
LKNLFLVSALLALSASTPLLAISTCTSVASNLVANCGFESGDLTGWTVTPAGYLGQYYGVDTVDANTGTYGAYLAGQTGDVNLSQDLATTAGTAYYFNFSLAHPDTNYAPYTNDFSASADGNQVLYESEQIFGYTDYSFGFTATSSSTTIDFAAFDPLSFFSLDDVSVYVAPEPSTFALSMPLFLVGTLLFARRRKALLR